MGNMPFSIKEGEYFLPNGQKVEMYRSQSGHPVWVLYDFNGLAISVSKG